MSIHYFQIEAINLDTIIFDTHDNRCMRAGSFLLLDLMDKLKDAFEEEATVIFAGGSQLLLKKNCSADEAKEFSKRLWDKARKMMAVPALSTASITAAFVTSSDNFPADMRTLQTKLRRQQLEQPRVWLEKRELENSQEACSVHGQLPAHPGEDGISASVVARRKEGSELRGKYFKKYTGFNDLQLTDNLEELCDNGPGNLKGKMALLQLDGNSFGDHRKRAQSSADWKRFSRELAEIRNCFLKKLVSQAEVDPEWQNGRKLQIEALMLGGDEMTLAVPAWRGWQTLKLFFDTVKGKAFDREPLTWSAGLVFCHHKAPLRHVRQLADDLCNRAKLDGKRQLNACHTLVMESFDGLTDGIDSYFEGYLNPQGCGDDQKITSEMLLLDADHLDQDESDHLLVKTIGRGQLYAFVQDAHFVRMDDGKSQGRTSFFKSLETKDNEGLCPAYRKLLDSAESAAGGLKNLLEGLQEQDARRQLAFWMMQIELLDYINVSPQSQELSHA